MKKIFNIAIIVTIFILNLSILNLGKINTVQASENSEEYITIAKLVNPSEWKPANPGGNSTELRSKVGDILGVIKAIGIILSVGVLVIIGIRQVWASAEEKSILKEAMPAYILGVVLLALMTTLPSIIYDVVNKWNS